MDLTQTRYDIDRGIATITLHRPDSLNAFTPVMREELITIFAEADMDDAVRVVVITGAGKAFCAGADLSGGGSTFDRSEKTTISDPQSAHLMDSRCFYWVGKQKDAREGISSFLEKRQPNFTMSSS